MTAPAELTERAEIRRRVRNIYGAISSNQVIDKDVEGQAKRLLEYIDALPAIEAGWREPEQQLADEILAELVRARTKFPGKNVTFAALVEEVGELATATFEETRGRVRKEAVQVAVMAMRMVLDGDHTFDGWRASKGLDALTDNTPSLHSSAVAAAIAETGGRGL